MIRRLLKWLFGRELFPVRPVGARCRNCVFFDDIMLDPDDPDDVPVSKCWKELELTPRGEYTPWRHINDWCQHWQLLELVPPPADQEPTR